MAKVLLVMNREGTAHLLYDLLVGKHWTVTLTSDPDDAIQMLQKMEFDLIISDRSFRDINVSDGLRVKDAVPNTPFILLSGWMGPEELATFRQSKVKWVIEKPFENSSFMNIVEQAAQKEEPDEMRILRWMPSYAE